MGRGGLRHTPDGIPPAGSGGTSHSWAASVPYQLQGREWRGAMHVERLLYYDTYRISGQFRDSHGNLAEFEVLTNQPGGVGGLWFNPARHREIRIQLQCFNGGSSSSPWQKAIILALLPRAPRLPKAAARRGFPVRVQLPITQTTRI